MKFILFVAGIGHSLNHSTKSVIKPSLNWSGAVARVSLERAAAMGRPLTPMPWRHPSEALSLGPGWRVTPGVIPISHSPFLEVTLTTNPSLVDSCHQKLQKQVMVSADYTVTISYLTVNHYVNSRVKYNCNKCKLLQSNDVWNCTLLLFLIYSRGFQTFLLAKPLKCRIFSWNTLWF